jgi:hypothetical protein
MTGRYKKKTLYRLLYREDIPHHALSCVKSIRLKQRGTEEKDTEKDTETDTERNRDRHRERHRERETQREGNTKKVTILK